jgi:hypothetical protein
MCPLIRVLNAIPKLAALTLCAGLANAQQNVPKAEPTVLSTGVMGSMHGSGLENPQYVLSFVPVQPLVLWSVHQPPTAAEIDSGIQGHSSDAGCAVETWTAALLCNGGLRRYISRRSGRRRTNEARSYGAIAE